MCIIDARKLRSKLRVYNRCSIRSQYRKANWVEMKKVWRACLTLCASPLSPKACLPVCSSVSFLPLCLYKCMYDFFVLSLPACLCFLLYLSQSSNLSIIFSVVLTYFPKSFSSLPIPSHTTPPLPCYHTNINEIQINTMTQQGERGDVGEKKR